MLTIRSRAPAREHALVLGVLLALAAACWVLLVREAGAGRGMGGAAAMGSMGGMQRGGSALTMGMGAALFMAMWVAMMVAMMFPTAAPMILAFATVQTRKRGSGGSGVPTWLFVAGYLLVWTALGLLAYALAIGAGHAAGRSAWFAANGARIGGVLLIAAGLYQITPLKRACLTTCRTPWQFILTSWRDGRAGAFRMGVVHGAYCTGCCWLLFLILFPLGIMNVAAMAVITALIYAEKSMTIGVPASRLAAGVLVAYGALVVVVPGVLPTAV